MWKVSASNLLSGRSFQAWFETEPEATQWSQKMIAKDAWGKKARQAIKGDGSYDESLVLSEFDITDPLTSEVKTVVSLRDEYDHSIDEIQTTDSGSDAKELRAQVAEEKISQWKIFTEFGKKVQLYFTALINERDFTQEQKDSIQSSAEILQILNELNFGRIAKAKQMVDSLSTDETLFYSDDLTAISLYMSDFLERFPVG